VKSALKPRHALLGVALAGAAGLVLFGDRTPAGESIVVEAAPRAPARAPAAVPRSAQPPAQATAPRQQILALVPRDELIGEADTRMGQDGNGGGAVFGHQDWTPPPPPPPPPQPAPPPPPPQAPPLPYTFIGKAVADGAWEVYLGRGDQTYVVRAHTVIDGMYRVDAIAPPVLTLTYLPLNQVQQLNIGVFD
jgi:hypothetical protein